MSPEGSFRCPWCGTLVSATVSVVATLRSPTGSDDIQYQTLRCAACGRGTLCLHHPDGRRRFFPPEGRHRIDVSHAPAGVAADYEEALRCAGAGAYRAAASMARRAVQSICLDRKADPKKRLVDQIDELHAAGEISDRLRRLGHGVRWYGNDAAHPDASGVELIDEPEADRALRFLEHLVLHVYTIDAELEAQGDDRTATRLKLATEQ